MKFLENLQINQNSKVYITGLVSLIVVLFLVTAVVFLVIIANNLSVVMSQPAGVTYTYFIMITDRILSVLALFGLLPLTIFQIVEKNKSKVDKTISIIAVIIFLLFAGIFFAGEYYIFNKYNNGELGNSKMFESPTVETKIFDKIRK